ncbi:glycosyltransferase [Lutibacter holmesii]|uniref:Glycosyltransferase n=1 Tax=Lutibacter holmesii TaxID=1137985 RepID=A0ABW3WP63_9FLAO
MKTIGIVILNYNNYSDTINCIKSVYKFCSSEELTLVIVDNGSNNNSIVEISSFLKQCGRSYEITESNIIIKKTTSEIILIKSNENLGYARGNNLGIRFLIQQKVEHILVLNNDILLTNNLIKPLINSLNLNPTVGLISPILMKDDTNIDYNCCRNNPTDNILISESIKFLKIPMLNEIIAKKYFLKSNPELILQEMIKCDIISGACILAKTSTWEQLNGFDENTFLYYEENILYEKLKKLNLKMALLTCVSAIHLGAKSTKVVQNTKLLSIELESLLYYLENYRKINRFKIILIQFFRLFQIHILNTYNLVKK